MRADVVEKVARAMDETYGCLNCGKIASGRLIGNECCDRPNWFAGTPKQKAQAAITALLEVLEDPSEEMIHAGFRAALVADDGHAEADTWKAMLSAFREEG